MHISVVFLMIVLLFFCTRVLQFRSYRCNNNAGHAHTAQGLLQGHWTLLMCCVTAWRFKWQFSKQHLTGRFQCSIQTTPCLSDGPSKQIRNILMFTLYIFIQICYHFFSVNSYVGVNHSPSGIISSVGTGGLRLFIWPDLSVPLPSLLLAIVLHVP